MSFRKLQVESLLRRTLSVVLSQKLSDPRIRGMISVTKVTVSPDFHDAYVYISVLPAEHEKKTLAGLRHASRYIHRLVADEVAMGSVPQLDFRVDDALKKEAAFHQALRRATHSEGDAPAAPGDEAAAVLEAVKPDNTRQDAAPTGEGEAPRAPRDDKPRPRPRQRRVGEDGLELPVKPDRRSRSSKRPRRELE